METHELGGTWFGETLHLEREVEGSSIESSYWYFLGRGSPLLPATSYIYIYTYIYIHIFIPGKGQICENSIRNGDIYPRGSLNYHKRIDEFNRSRSFFVPGRQTGRLGKGALIASRGRAVEGTLPDGSET